MTAYAAEFFTLDEVNRRQRKKLESHGPRWPAANYFVTGRRSITFRV